jgi:hypothetical protein
MGLTFLHPDTNESDFLCPIQILKHMRHLHYVHVGCCYWRILTPGFFSIFSINRRLQQQIAKTVSPIRVELRFEFTVRGV